MNIVEKMRQEGLRDDLPDFKIGDSINVAVRIKEGQKSRIQNFIGDVIAKHGTGHEATVTVRNTGAPTDGGPDRVDGPPASEGPRVSPGSGVAAVSQPEGTVGSAEPPRRRRIRRRVGSRHQTLKNYLLAGLLCIVIGLVFWLFGRTLSSGLFGIGFQQAPVEQAP